MYKCNKSKTHQSIKIEKENENIKLRKKMNSLTTDRNLPNKKETVWDRLSKITKVAGTNNVLGVRRSRYNLAAETSQRIQPVKQPSFKQSIQPARKQLTPTSSSITKHSRGICVKTPNIFPEFDSPTHLLALPGKEIVTSSSLSEDSKSSSNSREAFGKFANAHSECSSEDSNEEYTLAPLLTSYSKSFTNALNNAGEILRLNKKSATYGDIELVRCANLKKNPELFEENLEAQLYETSNYLECPVNLQPSLEMESTASINKIASYSGHNKETQKVEVDVIFKNIPSLNKEIEILKALGEKLSATLKGSTSHITRRDAVPQISITPSTEQLLKICDKDPPVVVKVKYAIYDSTVGQNAQLSVQLIGIRHCVGLVKEFRMAQKSIVELKSDSSRIFYVPSNSESAHLIRTSFKKLKETPNELLRLVKPKNSQIVFNVLEQDPIFFHSAFHKLPNIPYRLSTNYNHYEGCQLSIKQPFCGGGNSHFRNTSDDEACQHDTNFSVAKNESKNTNLVTFKSEYGSDAANNQLFNTPPLLDPLIRGKHRRRIRRRMTPMPESSYYCPKNSLLKTILIGFVQMSVFIVFIMALTYPQVRC